MAKKSVLVLVYGDSLSMPRGFDGVRYADTYPERVRDNLESYRPDSRVAIFNRSRGGAPVGDLHKRFVQDAIYFGPDEEKILVIQCGIVDCAPRPLPPAVRRLVSRLPTLLRWPIIRVLHYLRPVLLRAGLSWKVTDPRAFRSTLVRWLKTASANFKLTYIIGIAPTLDSTHKHSPGLSDSIVLYNSLIVEAANMVGAGNVRVVDVYGAINGDPSAATRYVNSLDGHHITAEGHQLYARLICEIYAEVTDMPAE